MAPVGGHLSDALISAVKNGSNASKQSRRTYVGIGSREHDLAGDSITNLRTSPDETARQVPDTSSFSQLSLPSNNNNNNNTLRNTVLWLHFRPNSAVATTGLEHKFGLKDDVRL